MPGFSFQPLAPSAAELIKTGSQWSLSVTAKLYLFYSSLLRSRWIAFHQAFNFFFFFLKSPLKATLEMCRPNRFKFQTVPGYWKQEVTIQRLWGNECNSENLKLHGDNITLPWYFYEGGKKWLADKIHNSGISASAGKRNSHSRKGGLGSRSSSRKAFLTPLGSSLALKSGIHHSVKPRQLLTLNCLDSNLPMSEDSRKRGGQSFVLLLQWKTKLKIKNSD